MLNEEQTNYAKIFLKEFSKEYGNKLTLITETESKVDNSQTISAFKSFMEEEFSEIPTQAVNIMLDLDKQLINWLHFIGKNRINVKTEPLDFWLKDSSTESFMDLKNIALNILCTPSSTATVERVFSAAGNACIGRKNRLSEKRLEMIVFFKNNAKYLNALNFLK